MTRDVDLRETAIVSLEETQKSMRHSKITTTQIYDRHAASVVAAALFA